jgi:hypothetical protein
VSTLTGSQIVLLPERNVYGNVNRNVDENGDENDDGNPELPPMPRPPRQPLPENQPGAPEPAMPIQERPLQDAEPGSPVNPRANMPEWKSWKINYPWLSFLLVLTISLIATIITLDIISRRNDGFAPLTNAPGFLARDPEIERAIWAQGILYTSFPAFIMTLYRTMWESTVSAFADRQPYIDLKKAGGRPAKATIMLDYKT